jgi:hypothetical protein
MAFEISLKIVGSVTQSQSFRHLSELGTFSTGKSEAIQDPNSWDRIPLGRYDRMEMDQELPDRKLRSQNRIVSFTKGRRVR